MKKVYWQLFFLLWFAYVFVHQRHFDRGTPVSRLDLLYALVVDKSFAIDAYHTNTPDKAFCEDHYYSDKAPGTVVLALPAFAATIGVQKLLGVDIQSREAWLAASWIACAGSIAIVTALGGVALFAWLLKWVPPKPALVTTLALFLGAAPFPYATMMFSHAFVVGLIAVALWALGFAPQTRREELCESLESSRRDEVRESRELNGNAEMQSGTRGLRRVAYSAERTRPSDWSIARRDALAGIACGFALASEFTAGLIVVGIAVWLAALDWRRVIPFAIAAIPPLLLIPAYSWACFGNPFVLPYSFQASFPEMKEGLYAIQWPDLATAYNLLFSPTRGLFFWTPFLAIAALGYWRMLEGCPRAFWPTYVLPVLQIVVVSGRVWDWQAGFTLGPRYLAPILPLLALPCAVGVQKFARLAAFLATYSILITMLAVCTDATPRYDNYNPLTELNLPMAARSEWSPNIGSLLGASATVSIFFLVGFMAATIALLWRNLSAIPHLTKAARLGDSSANLPAP